MDEEVIVNLAGMELTKAVPGLYFPFDPALVIPLLDAQTGEPTGQTTTGLDIYTALYSLYIMQATARDSTA
jgi:hypothetical protein